MTAVVPNRPGEASDAPSPSSLFGLGLALVIDGTPEDAAVTELVTEAGNSYRALERAYGRGVAVAAEYPDDSAVKETLELLAKALRRALRPATSAGPW